MRFSRFLAVVAAGMLAGGALGQEGQPANGGAHAQPDETPQQGGAPAPAQGGPLVSVDFKGGTLKELAVALRGATKEPVNISLQGDAAGVEVEPMSLRNVTVESALRAAIGNRIGTQFLPDGSGLELKFESVQSGPQDASVFVITRSPSSFRNSPPPPRERVEVLSIQRLVSGDEATTPDVVLTAIDTGLMLQQNDREPRPQIKFHKDSGLLLIRGDPQDVALASEIVKRMMSDHDRQTSEAARRKAASIERGAALRPGGAASERGRTAGGQGDEVPVGVAPTQARGAAGAGQPRSGPDRDRSAQAGRGGGDRRPRRGAGRRRQHPGEP
jgi:hypothetical protein